MSTVLQPPGETDKPRGAARAVAALVDDGTLDRRQADAVLRALQPVLRGAGASAAPAIRSGIRRHAAEVAGYVGAVFVGMSAVVFLARTWDEFSTVSRTLLLGGVAVLAGAVGALVVRGRPSAPTTEMAEARRRVAGTLFTAGATVAALTVWSALQDDGEVDSQVIVLIPLTGAVLAGLGYRLAPTALGQLATLLALLGAVFALEPLVDWDSMVVGGLAILAVGIGWFAMAYRGTVKEPNLGYALAGLTALLGAQTTGLVAVESEPGLGMRIVSYVLTASVALALLAAYATLTSWPLLAVGVLASVVVVIEVLDEWFGDTLQIPGLLLASGLTLLVASVAGMRAGRAGRRASTRPDPSEADD